MGSILAVCRVHELLPDAGSVGVTAIDKRPVAGRVRVRRLGLYADVQADRAHHGGTEQAVYAYAQEDAEHWAAELGREIPPGLFGENLRTAGTGIGTAVIGEVWRAGSVLMEVTQPRVPCATFQRRMGEERWVRRFAAENRTGAYLRVIEQGELGAGDAIEVVHVPGHGVRIADWFAAYAPRSSALRLGERSPASQEPDPAPPGVEPAGAVPGQPGVPRLADLARRLLDADLAADLTLSTEMRERCEKALTR